AAGAMREQGGDPRRGAGARAEIGRGKDLHSVTAFVSWLSRRRGGVNEDRLFAAAAADLVNLGSIRGRDLDGRGIHTLADLDPAEVQRTAGRLGERPGPGEGVVTAHVGDDRVDPGAVLQLDPDAAGDVIDVDHRPDQRAG